MSVAGFIRKKEGQRKGCNKFIFVIILTGSNVNDLFISYIIMNINDCEKNIVNHSSFMLEDFWLGYENIILNNVTLVYIWIYNKH